jgi:hypothetical protein
MTKRRLDHPNFNMRVNPDLLIWFQTYSQRQGKSMSAILKDYLRSLKRRDEQAQRGQET